MEIKKECFGTLCNGTVASIYTISNEKMSFSVTDYGCIITSIILPDGKGGKVDVALGYSTLAGYTTGVISFGAIVGRFANRIGNACFTVEGKEYTLDVNSGKNDSLHGGFFRYDKVVWDSKIVSTKNGLGVSFKRTSHDMEQGYPGNLDCEVIYTLNEENQIYMEYNCTTDKATPVNLTNHSYFNLAGRGTTLNHLMQLKCPSYLEVDEYLIPTGKLIPVEGTVFDFRTPKTIGKDIEKVAPGYDHCYVTEAYKSGMKSAFSGEMREIAVVTEPVSGRKMCVYSDQIGIQFYAGNYLDNELGKDGMHYQNHDAFCLETQCFPDTPNKKNFPSCILSPGEKYSAHTIYEFSF